MQDTKKFLQSLYTILKNNAFSIFILSYITLGILLIITLYKYSINPDATSYISIAKKYSNLDIKAALNGYWGPLYSILIALLIRLNIDPLIAARTVNVFASTFILFIFFKYLTRVINLKESLSWLITLGLSSILLTWTMTGPITPDILFSLFLLIELLFLKSLIDRKNTSNKDFVLLGLIGAMLYFTKSFGLYFFIVQIIVIFSYIAFITHKKRYLLYALKVTLFCLLFILPFVAALSIKYNKLTLGTTAQYNHAVVSPATNGLIKHPMDYSGPYAPPNSSAYSVWEDPSTIKVKSWSIYKPYGNLLFVKNLFLKNLFSAKDIVISFGVFISLGILISISSIFMSKKSLATDIAAMVGLSAIILIVGYSLILVESRYLWCLGPLGLLVIAIMVKKLKSHSKIVLISALISVIFSFWTLYINLSTNAYSGRAELIQAKRIGTNVPSGSKVLSDNFASIYTCYFLNYKCYGMISPNKDNINQLSNTVILDNIEYFIDYGTQEQNIYLYEFLGSNAKLLKTVHGNNKEIKIYKFD